MHNAVNGLPSGRAAGTESRTMLSVRPICDREAGPSRRRWCVGACQQRDVCLRHFGWTRRRCRKRGGSNTTWLCSLIGHTMHLFHGTSNWPSKKPTALGLRALLASLSSRAGGTQVLEGGSIRCQRTLLLRSSKRLNILVVYHAVKRRPSLREHYHLVALLLLGAYLLGGRHHGVGANHVRASLMCLDITPGSRLIAVVKNDRLCSNNENLGRLENHGQQAQT